MTGHQDLPSSGRNFNEATAAIPVRQALEGLGVRNIDEVDAYKQSALTELVKAALARNEFNVIIAKHPCMLKFTRERRKKAGYVRRHVQIDQGECRRIRECIGEVACPTFGRGEDGSIQASPDLCIGDGSCIQTCPAKAIHPLEEGGPA